MKSEATNQQLINDKLMLTRPVYLIDFVGRCWGEMSLFKAWNGNGWGPMEVTAAAIDDSMTCSVVVSKLEYPLVN